MASHRSKPKNRSDRSPDRHHHRHRSRSPLGRPREDERRIKSEKHRQGSAEIDLRRVKQEPRDDSDRMQRGHVAPSSSPPPPRRAQTDQSSPRRQDDFRKQREDRRKNDIQRIKHRNERGQEKEHWGRDHKPNSTSDDKKAVKKEKEKPSLALSGALTEDTNSFRGVVIKYNEPPEARRPKKRWRFYPFKADEQLPVLHLHRQSAFLLGRDRRIADIPVDHPSCSKQHAVLQFRLVEYTRPDGRKGRRVRPYVIDLGSANGTYVNNQRIEAQRYVELMEKDVVKFGFSSREYVLLHDSSDTSELEDDEGVEDTAAV